jgi:histidine triad (HIT) family protein
MQCVFCAIVTGEAPSETVYTDDACVAFMDVNPWARGHLLVVPRAHAADLWALDEAEAAQLMVAVRRVADLVRRGLEPDGLNLFQASGAAAFQTVFHFHMHVLPRWSGDGIALPILPRPGNRDEIAGAAAAIRGAA